MGQIFKNKGDDDGDDNDFSAGFTIPKTKSFTESTLAQEHQSQQEEEDEEDKKKGKPKKKKKQTSAICCCGSPCCRIGPFVETEKSSDE